MAKIEFFKELNVPTEESVEGVYYVKNANPLLSGTYVKSGDKIVKVGITPEHSSALAREAIKETPEISWSDLIGKDYLPSGFHYVREPLDGEDSDKPESLPKYTQTDLWIVLSSGQQKTIEAPNPENPEEPNNYEWFRSGVFLIAPDARLFFGNPAIGYKEICTSNQQWAKTEW